MIINICNQRFLTHIYFIPFLGRTEDILKISLPDTEKFEFEFSISASTLLQNIVYCLE